MSLIWAHTVRATAVLASEPWSTKFPDKPGHIVRFRKCEKVTVAFCREKRERERKNERETSAHSVGRFL